jgi:hypothetical protein
MSAIREVHTESYEDLVRHVDSITGANLSTLNNETLESKKQELTQYLQRIRTLQQVHRSHVERLEGIERNAEIQVERLRNAVQNRALQARIDPAQLARDREAQAELSRQRQIQDQQRQLQAVPSTTRSPLDTFAEAMRIQNAHQAEILERIQPSHSTNREIFLSSYTPNMDMSARRRHVEGEFSVLGTVRNGVRDAYTVTWYKPSAGQKSFWCSCPDQRFNGGKKSIYCKHISFLVCRVARILDADLFRTKQFTPDMHRLFGERIRSSPSLGTTALQSQLQSPTPVIHVPSPAIQVQPTNRNQAFRTGGKAIEAGDSCPICYDEFGATPHLSCPTCKNNMHQECMEVWLERNNTCVFCRSNVWHAYRR